MAQLLFTYLIVIVEVLFIHSVSKGINRKRLYFVFFFLQFSFFAGFRGLDNFPDTLSYAGHFLNVSSKGSFWEVDLDRFNYGFLVFEKFIHNNISTSLLVYNVITSTLICFCTLWLFYKKASHFGVAILLFYISGEYFVQPAILRESLAVISSYACFYCFEHKRYMLSFLPIILAISFHNSAIILIFILLLERFQLGKKSRTYVFVTVVVVAYLIAPTMEFVLNLLAFETKYFTEGVEKGFATLNGFFNGTVGILISFFVYKMLDNCKKEGQSVLYSSYNNYVYMYLLISILTLRLSILSRYLMFLNPFMFILISNLIFLNRKNIKYALLVTGVFAANIIIKQLFRPEWIYVFPYQFYDERQINLIEY